jgi:O-antigen ligase
MVRVKTYLHHFIRLGLYGILLTPVLFFPWFSSPFLTSKVLPFQVLVELIVAAVILVHSMDIALAGRKAGISDLIPASSLSVAIGAFIGYAFISAALGTAFQRSLWGIESRQDGLVILLHFYGWLCVLLWLEGRPINQEKPRSNSHGRDRKKSTPEAPGWNYLRYMGFSYAVSVIVAATVIFDWIDKRYNLFGVIPEYFTTYHASRGSGVFGNPWYVAPYLLFHLFFGLYGLRLIWRVKDSQNGVSNLERGKGIPRAVWMTAGLIICQALLLIALILGQVRAALLSLLAGSIFWGILLMASNLATRRVKIAAAGLAIVLVIGGGALWNYRNSPSLQNIPLLGRLQQANIEATVSTRITLWKSALRGISDRPLFGWGRSNIFRPLEKYYDPVLVREDYRAADYFEFFWYDKSHNAFIDLLVEMGVLGVLAFLGVLVIVIRLWWQVPDLAASACLGTGLVSYAVSNVLAFDSFGSLFGLCLFLGWLSWEAGARTTSRRQPADATDSIKREIKSSRRSGSLGPAAIIGSITVTLIGAMVYLNFNMAMASIARAKAMNALYWNHAEAGLSFFRDSLTYFSPYTSREKLTCAVSLTKAVLRSQQRPIPEEISRWIPQLAAEGEKENSDDAVALAQLGTAYLNLATEIDRVYLPRAEACAQKALELSPKRLPILTLMGNIYLLKSEPARAVDIFKKMADNYYAFPLAHWYYALGLIKNGQLESARTEVRTALNLGYRFTNERESRLAEQLLGNEEFIRLMRGK